MILIPHFTKYCNKCSTTKNINEFSKAKREKDGLQSKCKECAKNHYLSNKEHYGNRMKEYYVINRDQMVKQMKDYRETNKEYLSAKSKIYYQSNKEHINNYHKEWYELNKKECLNKQKLYSKTPKGRVVKKNISHRRRTKFKQGDVTTNQLIELQQNAKVCYWCKCSLKGIKTHVDHYTPIYKGGLHTLSNLVVSCQPCNNKKHIKDPIVFANSIGRLL